MFQSLQHDTPETIPLANIRLGLAMWSHHLWQTPIYGANIANSERLARYANVFNTVEGNTSFYATPRVQTVKNWHSATPPEFKFTFKLPQTVTHQRQLQTCQQEVRDFFTVMEPLIDKTGIWKIQLPAYFGPESLATLAQFLTQLPTGLTYGVEVRHKAFFAKGDAERDLNRLLMECGINRIIMDSRPLFALPPSNSAIIDAHKKKPKVPVHAIATANQPVVRFIGQNDDAVSLLAEQGIHPLPKDNTAFFNNWLRQLPAWLDEGKEPYLFVHTPDNINAPQLAVRLYKLLQTQLTTHAKGAYQLPNIDLLEAAPENTPQLDLW